MTFAHNFYSMACKFDNKSFPNKFEILTYYLEYFNISMSKIGLIITINKFSTYFESNSYTYLYETINDARNKLVDTLVENFKYINIDFPDNLVDFEYLWFKQQYVNANSFTYKVFEDNRWSEPWDSDDIYDDVLVKLEEYEIQNAPDFSKMYGEPDPESMIDTDDKSNIEYNEQTHEFETKLKEIITQAQNIKMKDDEVKDCPCEKCQEGYVYQQMKKDLEQEYTSCIKPLPTNVSNTPVGSEINL